MDRRDGSTDVDPPHAFEHRRGGLLERSGFSGAGGIDQQQNGAVHLDSGGEGFRRGGFVRDVGRDGKRGVARVNSLLQRCSAPAENRHVGAGRRQYRGDRSANAGPSAGDQRVLSRKARCQRRRLRRHPFLLPFAIVPTHRHGGWLPTNYRHGGRRPTIHGFWVGLSSLSYAAGCRVKHGSVLRRPQIRTVDFLLSIYVLPRISFKPKLFKPKVSRGKHARCGDRRRPGGSVFRDPAAAGPARGAYHRRRTQSPGRYLRFRRGVQRPDSGHVRRGRRAELPGDRGEFRLLGRYRDPRSRHGAPHRRQRVLRLLAPVPAHAAA